MTTFTSSFKHFAMLLCVVALTACDKNAVQDITGSLPASRVRFFHFGVNAPGVNFYANANKVTAISSSTGSESTTGTVYGGVGSAGFYSAMDPGQYSFTGRIAATVDKDVPILTVPLTLADGKAYSVYMSGFYNTTAKTVEGFAVEDDFSPTIDFAVASVRFVNAISNSNPMTMYAKNTTTLVEVPVGGLVAYKAAGNFTNLAPGTYDLSTRVSGSSVNTIVRTGVVFASGRVYTISARGDITVSSATATNRPFLDNTANR
jgi:hypothetical protein